MCIFQTTISSTPASTAFDIVSNSVTTTSHREVDDAAVQQAVEEVAAVVHKQDVIRVAHAMAHDISHGEPVSHVAKVFAVSDCGYCCRLTRFDEKCTVVRTARVFTLLLPSPVWP